MEGSDFNLWQVKLVLADMLERLDYDLSEHYYINFCAVRRYVLRCYKLAKSVGITSSPSYTAYMCAKINRHAILSQWEAILNHVRAPDCGVFMELDISIGHRTSQIDHYLYLDRTSMKDSVADYFRYAAHH